MTKQLTNEGIEQRARIISLVGDNTRIRIIRLLFQQKRVNVSDIADSVGMSVACTSHHLQLLKDNKIVFSRKEGVTIYYSLLENKLIKQFKSLIF